MNKKPTSRSPNTAWLTGWNDGLDALADEQATNSRIGFLYEELRKAIDEGSESMTHDDALKQIAYWQDKGQAQAQEPVAYLIDWPDEPELGHYFSESATESGRSTPLFTHPTPPPAGDRASLIRRADASVTALNSRIMEPFYCSLDQDAARVLSDCVDMLEADADLADDLTIAYMAGVETGRKQAQQVAVPAGYVLVPIEPTSEMISAMSASKAKDCEGVFPALMDLIDFSGENKTHAVLKAAYKAMLAAAQGGKP